MTLLVVVASSIAAPTIVLAVVIIIAVTMDAYRSQGSLKGIRVTLPEVVRISKGKEGNFNLQIENPKLKIKRMRLGLAFPEEIFTPAVELRSFAFMSYASDGQTDGRTPVRKNAFGQQAFLWRAVPQ